MDERITEDLLTWVKSHYFGKYRGQVEDTNDETLRGRLLVTVPAVLGQEKVWAMPCVPYAGDKIGSYLIPKKGSGVWIEFEGGDPSYPVWSGCFWADGELPQEKGGSKDRPRTKVIRTEKALMLTMDDKGQEIILGDTEGNNVLTILVQPGKVILKGNMKAIVEAPAIELVENATHPVVFGDDLLQFLNQVVLTFNTHLHVGQLALGVFPVTPIIPSAPLAPPAPSMLSLKVKTG